jgi:DNA helicase-2/ATP-dependent DNA helicase PcrA
LFKKTNKPYFKNIIMDVSHILDNLNKPQRDAVSSAPQSLLVLAGAGSGKTRVLVHRIAWLLEVEKASPFSILSVTFTNKAAKEMRCRIEQLLTTPSTGMWVGTFHGLAHRLLRRHYEEAKLPQGFQILDSDDQLSMVRRIQKELSLDTKQWPPRQSQWFINKQKDQGIRSHSMEHKGDYTTRTLIAIYTAYEALCERSGVVDFAELLLRSLELIRDNAHIMQHYQQRFQHILVDEFQDTNELQYAWLQLLAGRKNLVFAVGDDDQSIYGWRGAKIENIQNFAQDFNEVKTVKLEQNYRSTSNILQAANALIAHNKHRLGKNLWTEDKIGEPIKLYAAYNENEEATHVATEIQQWLTKGRQRDEIAILYRSNAQSRVFESIFIEKGIPYRVYGGLRFFERAEVKSALAYLRLTTNRDDDASFERSVNFPPRGIGDKTVSMIRDYGKQNNLSLWQASKIMLQANILKARAGNSLQNFLTFINNTATEIQHMLLSQQVDFVIQQTKLIEYYNKKEGDEKGKNREENLEELVSAANSFEYKPDDEHANMSFLAAFLAHATLEAGEGGNQNDEDCVQMMTMHSSKGLEFPRVFICGMEDGLFPHQNALNEAEKLEEERRLCYVAITRAREQLTLCYAEQRRMHGNTLYGIPSQFIDEIPDELIKSIRTINKIKKSPVLPTPKKRPANETGYAIGQKVSHSKFGSGTILDNEGAGAAARVQVNFETAGSKWLVLTYANLQKL